MTTNPSPALRALTCVVASLTLAIAASAQGSDRQINQVIAGQQTQVDLAVEIQGSAIYVWTSQSSSGNDLDESIQVRLLNPFRGTQPAQQQLNTTTAGMQYQASVALLDDGNFVAVWVSADDPANPSIRGRRIDVNGNPLSAEFAVNAATAGTQLCPSVAPLPGARFVVVWDSSVSSSDNDGDSIQGQRFASDAALGATPEGAQLEINQSQVGHQRRASVAADPLGNFVVAWDSASSAGSDDSGLSVQARRYDAAGVPDLQGEFQVNTSIVDDQRSPALTMGPDGFVIAWESQDSTNARGATLDTHGFSVQALRFDASSAPVSDAGCDPTCDPMTEPSCDLQCEDGNDFQVNTFTAFGQRFPDIASKTDGEFLVAWDSNGSSGDDDSFLSIQRRRFGSDGSAAPDESGGPQDDSQANGYIDLDQSLPAVHYSERLRDFELAWQSLGSDGDDDDEHSIPEPGRLALALAALATLRGLGAGSRRG